MSSNKTFAEQAPGATGVDFNHPAERDFGFEIVDAERAIIRPLGPVRKKIAVCGFAASSRMLAPFDDPAWECWLLNQLYRHTPRASRHFDIHQNWREENVDGTDHPKWLAECGIPVYMTEVQPSIPTSVRYPLEAVIAGVTSIDYFTSTVAFMLGLAIWEIDQQVDAEVEALRLRSEGNDHAEGRADADEAWALLLNPGKFRRWLADCYAEREIGIFGIDLIVGDEYIKQKQCVEFLLGIAQARGITIRIPPQSALLKQQWRYGYEREPQAWPIRLTELQNRAEALQAERTQLIAKLQTIDGAIQDVQYWYSVADLRLKNGAVRLNEEASS